MKELVFIHGWGFDAGFWDDLAGLLADVPQRRVDRGYFQEPSEFVAGSDQILIGHSLGFIHGLTISQTWSAWIAINSFPRFSGTLRESGCVPSFILREMQKRFTADPAGTLAGFYDLIGATHSSHAPKDRQLDVRSLSEGLEELQACDITAVLNRLNRPGCVLASREDPLVPAKMSEALGRLALQGEVSWGPSRGHLLPRSEPVWCAEVIRAFIQGLSSQDFHERDHSAI